MAKWTAADMPDQSGRVALVTGANSGIGWEATWMLAAKGADVIMACRTPAKAERAREAIEAKVAGAKLHLVTLDLASLASIEACAEEVKASWPKLDLLINNAGVMALPYRTTADGFEMQFGTNHLGHFALTARLFGAIRAAGAGARVVNVSSMAHNIGKIRFDDPNWERGYSKWPAYGQSKLANLVFTYEMQRKLDAAGWDAPIACACHPGYAATNLQSAGPQMSGSTWMEPVMQLANSVLAQSSEAGAWPTVYAACAPGVRGADYIGPDGFSEWRGHPVKVSSSARSHDELAGKRLWEMSEQMTGLRFEMA